MRTATVSLLLLLPVLAGCATPIDAPLSPTFGAAVASLQAQIIPPPTATDEPPQTSAERGAAAIRRYERGQPKAPQNTFTSAVSSAVGADTGQASIDK